MGRMKCRKSNREYLVRNEDIAFYQRVSPIINGKTYLIPPPTLAPTERERARLAFRNERTLYKRISDLSNQEMISIYHPDSPYQVYTQDE